MIEIFILLKSSRLAYNSSSSAIKVCFILKSKEQCFGILVTYKNSYLELYLPDRVKKAPGRAKALGLRPGHSQDYSRITRLVLARNGRRSNYFSMVCVSTQGVVHK